MALKGTAAVNMKESPIDKHSTDEANIRNAQDHTVSSVAGGREMKSKSKKQLSEYAHPALA